ncbi:hydrogenase nickel incorporation protein HypB [bacterium]|nr:hydrogenase nickel incorporation protein HypB [bacterium]MBU1638010.1 hydrogenase nickel incorporation protein HypB [bacterium]MBU1920418.1 hydrogenase nickel incorporation protein HypB [bacterium]
MEIPLVRDVLKESNARAEENRSEFKEHRVFVVNVMSSPGSGKTEILKRTISDLRKQNIRCAVIEGDITSTLDSERLTPLGIPVVQANTEPFGGDCHIGSHLVQGALKHLDLDSLDVLFIENVGNLVCPAEFDLGEDKKVVVLSLPEGSDKPLKYPLMFRECHACLANKTDLAPYLDVNLAEVGVNVNRINENIVFIPLSAKTGDGFDAWIEWILYGIRTKETM